MSYYRQVRTAGGTYFFTVVTYRRRPILADEWVINELRLTIAEIKQTLPFVVEAWVVLPDHMHCIWTLPPSDRDYSTRMGKIKSRFTARVKSRLHNANLSTPSQQQRRESTIWQRRFWEHEIRDQRDYEKHIDYIHFNPVKHGVVKKVADWPYSTFHKYVEQGIYSIEWSGDDDIPNLNFGE